MTNLDGFYLEQAALVSSKSHIVQASPVIVSTVLSMQPAQHFGDLSTVHGLKTHCLATLPTGKITHAC